MADPSTFLAIEPQQLLQADMIFRMGLQVVLLVAPGGLSFHRGVGQ